MGIKATCDCCGEEVETIHERGFVKKVYYGDCCIGKYQEYEDAFNELHTRIVEQFESELIKLRSKYGKLPD